MAKYKWITRNNQKYGNCQGTKHQHRGEQNIWLQVFFHSGYSHDTSVSKSNIQGGLQAVLSLHSLLHTEVLDKGKTTKNNEQP